MIKKTFLPIFLLLLALPVSSIETLPLDTDVSFSMTADQSMEFLLYVENLNVHRPDFFNISFTVSSFGKGRFLALGLNDESRAAPANFTEFMEQKVNSDGLPNSNETVVIKEIDNQTISFSALVRSLDYNFENDSENYAKLILFSTVDVNVTLNVAHLVFYPQADPTPDSIIPIGIFWVLPFLMHPRILKKLEDKSRKKNPMQWR